MMSALFLAAVVATPPARPVRLTVATRARIVRGERIDFNRPGVRPAGTILRKGLIEFF